MVEHDWLSERFAEHQGRLHAVAYRMLGSPSEAEDAVQEAWLRVGCAPAAVWSHRGQPKAVFTFTISEERITRIAIDADPDRLRDLDIVFLPASGKERS